MAVFSKFFGRAASDAAGFAAGIAVGPALGPVVQEVVNRAWEAHPDKRIDAGTAAAIVAEDVRLRDFGVGEAAAHGYDSDRFDALLGEALNAPGIGALFEVWRRDLIGDGEFQHGLRKAKLEPRWDAPLMGLKSRLLSLEELANARQQGFVDAARQRDESQLQGLDGERAEVLFELSGLPPGVDVAQGALNRGLIDDAEFAQIVREGHTKTKYTDLLRTLKQPILHATDYRTLHLKGWITEAEMNAGGALSGYTPAQMHLLYLEAGRPAAPGQMWTAAARGIDGPAGTPVDQAQFQKAVAESDIRPEYGPMLWNIRYTYPPLFQINRLVQANAITVATGVEWARKDRYAPEVVAALERYWGGGTTAAADPHVGKALTQLWTALHTSYRDQETDEATARDTLTYIGVPGAAQDQIVATWNRERALIRKQPSVAQLKTAYRDALMSRDEILDQLLRRGYSLDSADLLVAEWEA